MKRKRRQELFAFYDYTAIENHLSEMAKKGWMIEKINNYFWTYAQIPPKDITFNITYHSSASEFDPKRSEMQMTFDEFCEHAGWKLALSWHQMQIYYNGNENPTPIQTDPEIHLKTLHKAMWKNYLISNIIILLISVPLSVMFLISLMKVPGKIISSGTSLFTGILLTVLSVYIIFDLSVYFRWIKKALDSAEDGIFTDSPNTTPVQKTVIYFTYLLLAAWIINHMINADMLMLVSIGSYLASLIISFCVMDNAKDIFKMMNAPMWLNKILSVVVTFIAAFIVIKVFVLVVLLMSGNNELIPVLI